MRYEIEGQILTDIADSIREKTGKTELIKAEDMAEEISEIEGGGIVTGTAPPTSDIGNDGDYYIQMFPVASGVSFVEYLESSGTQYINTGIYPTSETGIRAEVYSTYSWCAGSRESDSASKGLNICGNSELSNGFSLDYNGTRYNASVARGVEDLLYFNPKVTLPYINATSILKNANNYWSLNEVSPYVLTNPFILFGVGKSGSVNISPDAKIKRITLYDGYALIADYLPCLDGNGVACMWDNVAEEYVYNDGTGDFLFGSATTPDPFDPLLYVKENGSWRLIGEA